MGMGRVVGRVDVDEKCDILNGNIYCRFLLFNGTPSKMPRTNGTPDVCVLIGKGTHHPGLAPVSATPRFLNSCPFLQVIERLCFAL